MIRRSPFRTLFVIIKLLFADKGSIDTSTDKQKKNASTSASASRFKYLGSMIVHLQALSDLPTAKAFYCLGEYLAL